jgi:hypothetical protein
MSDYHPDGGQLFWPEGGDCEEEEVGGEHEKNRAPSSSNTTIPPPPFVVCLGPASCGDDVRPEDMRAFLVPPGHGVYLKPGTWHNGVYVNRKVAPNKGKGACRFWTRQGRVHARVSCSWAAEFGALLRVRLPEQL